MADNINLPNLVSHLAVNLDGVSGAVADASRQGSSMGAALGRGVNQELEALLRNLPQVHLDGDSTDLDRDLVRIHRQLAQLDSQRIGVDIAIPDALRQIQTLQTQLQRLGDEHPDVNVQASTRQASRQLDELLAAARRVDDTDVDVHVDVHEDQLNRAHGLIGRLTGALGSLGGIGASVGKAALSIGSIVPAAASVVTTLANIAPAAGVAVTGLAAVQLASGAVKLASVGMGDAIKAALDPSKTKEYGEALKKLSPEARKFADAIHDAAPQLKALQQSVQERVFKGLGDQLERTGKSVLPVLRKNLVSSAGALNEMGKGVLTSAKELGDSGTLGKALGSASKGLHNLSGIPGVVVTSLGQIAAAAGPSFEGLTKGASNVATKIGKKLGDAFKSGAMQKAIEHAVDLLKQLMTVGSNVFKIIGNIFNAMPPGGGGLVGVLEDVSSALASITGTKAVQDGLAAIFKTVSTLGAAVAPLLAQALVAVAPIFTALGPPVQLLIGMLQQGLTPVIDALGPVLATAAGAVGVLVKAVAPLLPTLGMLIASLLPALTPLLAAAQTVFAALAPIVQKVAGILADTLAPILAQLPTIIGPLADMIANELVTFLGILGQVLVAVGPSLASLGTTAGVLLTALAPLITAFGTLATGLLQGLMPVLTPLIGLVGGLAQVLAFVLSKYVTGIVVPALTIVTDLLRGDFSGAWSAAKSAVKNAIEFISAKVHQIAPIVAEGVNNAIVWLKAFPGKALSALAGLAASLAGPALKAGAQLVSAIKGKISDAVNYVRGLPGRARSAIGAVSGVLAAAGRSLIQGFINGIVSKIGDVKSTLGGLTSKLTDWKGPPAKDAKILTPAGRLLITGFIKGIDDTTAKLRSRLESITKALPSNVKSGYGKTLAKATAELEKLVARRDGVIKKLATAQKKLDDLVKSRDAAASKITSGILDEANITSGHADVNSVTAITVGLQQSLKAAQAFQANIAKLKTSGLRSDLLQQIADAGVDAGGATAAALAKATPTELKRINDLQAQLAKSAASTGATVGDALYGAGIRAAQGLVAGLKSQESAIEKQMAKIANSMLSTVKKVHKTHSPSRAFADIGVMDMEGWRGGVLARAHRVIGAATSVAGSVLDAARGAGGMFSGTPSAGQLAAVYAGQGRGGDQINNFHLYDSEASPDGILRALSWHGLVGRP